MKGQPFFFDSNIFDEDQPLSEEEKAALPEFSQDELIAAKSSAFEEGKKVGIAESNESMTSAILNILQKIEQDINVIFNTEIQRQKQYEEEATHLAAQLFAKAIPHYMEAHGNDELKKAMNTALSEHMVPDTIQIDLNASIIENLSPFIKEKSEELSKKISLKTNPTLPQHACRISWEGGGGILCNRNSVVEKILNILNQSLAERDVSLHDGHDHIDNNESETQGSDKSDKPEETSSTNQSGDS